MKKEIIIELVMTLSAVLFLYAGFSKYADLLQFKNAMHQQPFSEWMIDLLIWTLPPVEILIAACLMIAIFYEQLRVISLCAFGLLMTLFSGYILAILMHLFPKVPCSCGGAIQALSWNQHLLLNLVFIVFTGVALYLVVKKLRSNAEKIQ